jgi:hypothetical protein
VSSESFAVTGAGDTTNLTSKNASTTAQTLASVTGFVLGTASGSADANNYNGLSTTSSAVTINKAKLTEVSGVKTYDGTTNLSGGTLSIKGVNGEEFTTTLSSVAIDSKNFADNATNKVNNLSGLTLTGKTNAATELASNYDQTQGATTNSVKITQKSLSALYTATNKVYDGNTNATVTGTLTDIVTGDAVTATHTSATFDTAAAGTNKTVTVAGIALTGGDASNYKLDPVVNLGNKASAKASITAALSIAPAPVVPTSASSSGGRVKIPTPEANPFQLASNGGLVEEDFCSDTNDASCACEETSQDKEVQFCTSKNSE